MSLDPDNFNPFGERDGTYNASCEKVDTTDRQGNPFVTRDGVPQINLRLVLDTGKKLSKYVMVEPDGKGVSGMLKAFGFRTADLAEVTANHFLDSGFANDWLRNRTCEVTLKTAPGRDGKARQNVYLNPIGYAADLEAKMAASQAGTAVAKTRFDTPRAAGIAVQAQAPMPQRAPAPATPPRWGQPPRPPAMGNQTPPLRQEQPKDDGEVPF